MLDIVFKKRVLFVGMPDMALVCFNRLFREGVNIVGVVPPPKSDISYDFFINFLDKYKMKVISYEKSLDEVQFLKKVKELNADIAVVCSYNKLFPEAFLACTKDGFLNCHPSLLPDYRGANPYSHTLINDEKSTGITIHFMDKTFDTGDIVFQKKFALAGNETMGILFNNFNYIIAEALLSVLVDYEQNGCLKRTPQTLICNKPAPAIKTNGIDNLINWGKKAKEIECFVRALNPFIIATSYFRGECVRISSVHFRHVNHCCECGCVCDTKQGLGIAVADGIVYIDILQYGSYLICSGDDLIKRLNIRTGEKFE